MTCRDTEFQVACYTPPAGECQKVWQHNVYNNGTGALTAVIFTDALGAPIDTSPGVVTPGDCPDPVKEPYNYCNAGVCTTVFKLTSCAGTVTWQNLDGSAYTATGVEQFGACGDLDWEVEQAYDVTNIGTPDQVCVEIEIVKKLKCDDTLQVLYFDKTGAAYTIAGEIRFTCPCIDNGVVDIVTDWAALPANKV